MTSMSMNLQDKKRNVDNDVDSALSNKKNSNRGYIPEKCALCAQELYIGISFFMFVCHVHGVCSSCERSEYGYSTWCPYCLDQEQMDLTETRPTYEVKNTLPLLPVTSNVCVTMAPSTLLYEYPPLHYARHVNTFSYVGVINLKDVATTCWPVGRNEKIIIGGQHQQGYPTLSVVSPKGVLVRHTVSCGRSVLSGVLLRNWIHIVCVQYKEENCPSGNKLHLFTLDPAMRNPINLIPLATLNVNNPVYVFRKNKQLLGVLCMDGSLWYQKSNSKIRLFGLDFLATIHDTDSPFGQSNALWGRRTLLHLNIPRGHELDTVVMTPKGQYCIASFMKSELRLYNRAGMYLYSIGEQGFPDAAVVNRCFYPISIQCTSNNRLIVGGECGEVHAYDLNSTSGNIKKKMYDIGYVQMNRADAERKRCDGSFLVRWFDDGGMDDVKEVLKKARHPHYYYLKDNTAGWSMLQDRQREHNVVYSTLTQRLRWVLALHGHKLYIYDTNPDI